MGINRCMPCFSDPDQTNLNQIVTVTGPTRQRTEEQERNNNSPLTFFNGSDSPYLRVPEYGNSNPLPVLKRGMEGLLSAAATLVSVSWLCKASTGRLRHVLCDSGWIHRVFLEDSELNEHRNPIVPRHHSAKVTQNGRQLWRATTVVQ